MTITRGLNQKSSHLGVGQISGHNRRRPAIERERRLHHAPIADWHQFGHSALARFNQDLNRIAASPRRRPLSVIAAWYFRAQCFAGGEAVRDWAELSVAFIRALLFSNSFFHDLQPALIRP